MAPYSKYFVVELSGVIIAITFAVYVYLKYVAFNYWGSKNVAHVKPTVPIGSLWPVFSGKLSIDNVIELIEWLKNHCTELADLIDAWRVTFESRRNFLLTENLSVAGYYEKFLGLRNQEGIELIKLDFNKLYPGKSCILQRKWPVVRDLLISKLQQCRTIRSVDDKLLVKLLPRLEPCEFVRDKYLEFKKSPIFGFYSFYKPTLVINNPDLIRLVLTKEFEHFHDRGMYCNEKIDPLSGNLFSIPGAKWRFLRTKFSPTFTSSKMKQMFFIVKECSDTLAACVAEQAKNSELVEVKDLMARFSTDIIASAAFGIQCNSLENPDAEFRKWGRMAFRSRVVSNTLSALIPQLLEVFKIPTTDKDVSNFFIRAFKETVEYRTANNVVRKDFMDLVMQLMNKGYIQENEEESKHLSEADTERITMLEGAAQAFVFWLAGFETSSSTATHCLYELALHQDIQDKVADEVNRVLEESGGITYESVKNMHYLHKVVSETLRKYPSVPILNRECTKECDLPSIDFRITKGTSIIIPVYGLHMDSDIYPDPEEFDPERFSEKNIASRHQYTYLPFGEGPRNCIGMRFGLVQTKIGLLSLLSKYRFKPGPDLQIPMQVDKGNFVVCPQSGITLRMEQR